MMLWQQNPVFKMVNVYSKMFGWCFQIMWKKRKTTKMAFVCTAKLFLPWVVFTCISHCLLFLCFCGYMCTPGVWCCFVPVSLSISVHVCASRVVWPSIWSCSCPRRPRHTPRQLLLFTIMFSSTSSPNLLKSPQCSAGPRDVPARAARYLSCAPDGAPSRATAPSAPARSPPCPPGHPTLVWVKPAHHNTLTAATITALEPLGWQN